MNDVLDNIETCGYCKGPLDASSAIAICSTCGIKQHRECWDEYGGCVLPGCTGHDKNRATPSAQPTPPQQVVDQTGAYAAPLAPAPVVPRRRSGVVVLVAAIVILLIAVIAAALIAVSQGVV